MVIILNYRNHWNWVLVKKDTRIIKIYYIIIDESPIIPTADPIKNLTCVKESHARSKEKRGVEELYKIHSNDQSNYRHNLRKKQEENKKRIPTI